MKFLQQHTWYKRFGFLFLAILFLIGSFVFNRLYSGRSSVLHEVRKAETYIAGGLNGFESLIADTARIRKLATGTETLDEFEQVARKRFSLYIYQADDLYRLDMKFWSDHQALPPPDVVAAADTTVFRKLSNGFYVIRKRTVPGYQSGQRLYLIAMVAVRSAFFLDAVYLPTKFLFSSEADQRVRLADHVTEFPVNGPGGQVLFYMDKKQAAAVAFNDRLTILLRFAGLLFLFLFIHFRVEDLSRKNKLASIGVLALVLLLLRVTSYWYPQLLNLRQFELFNPAIYGSNLVQRSLGDLLINAVLFCWWALFAWSSLRDEANPGNKLSLTWQRIAAGISILLLISSAFIVASVVRSMVADSKISFDVTNFFSLTKYTVVGFFVLACLSLSYYYFAQLLMRYILPVFRGAEMVMYFVIAGIGLAFLTLRTGSPNVLFYLPVLAWLLAFTWLISRGGRLLGGVRINIAGILAWIFIFSFSIAGIMLTQNREVEWNRRKAIADKLLLQTDPASETRMNLSVKYLDNDFLEANFYRFKDESQSRLLRDSIIAGNYSASINKYETRLYVYDSINRPLYNDDGLSYDALNIILHEQAKPTSSEGLYYYETSYEKFNYITKTEIRDSLQQRVGTLFVLANPKNYGQEALYPELFRKSKHTDLDKWPIYSSAVYESNILKMAQGNYAFPVELNPVPFSGEEIKRIANGDYEELWFRPAADKTVIVARKKERTIEAITLFSYIFCSFLFLVLFVQAISLVLKSGFSVQRLREMLQLNIRSQVHSTIIFISLFSFLVIGVATISFFISRNKDSNRDKLGRTMRVMVNEMEKKMADHSLADDVVKLYDSVSNLSLQQLVSEVADIHGVDVNVYDPEGNLQVSSQAYVYSRGILSRKMDPSAFYHLGRLRQMLHVQDEKIADFSYFSIYSPVRRENGEVYGYINIPYFTSRPELRQEISNFLVTIINLNAFIFLVAGLIALFITNRITRSFSLISEKMREVNLGKMNEPIEWHRNDEIGELVKEYNRMVAKLEESAAALAKSEREGAWREMARQVAHEIKNPLTPMKLHIQYLQKAINNNQPNVKELSANVASTLVEQIDHLSKIAADFSQFANIGNTNVTRFDLHDVIASLKDLYTADSKVQFNWLPVHRTVLVEADRTQMNRLFTNLFANAVEACNSNSVCQIEVRESIENNMLRVAIRDNGEGIAPEMQDRIFVPNFTTKSSGTGLGLAMCKGIVEKAHGRIWFETSQGQGTVFFVELPLVTVQD